MATSADQILITTGALAGVAATIGALLEPGQRVLVESTGYPNTLAAFRRAGARLIPVPDGESDPRAEQYWQVTRRGGAQAALVMPDFHNPTGYLMPDDQRQRIADAWRAHGVIGVVDETLLDTWWDSPVQARPMASFAPDCISVGSASKTIWGGLRIGWVRAPRRYVGAIVSARLSMDLGAPVLEQLVAADLLGAAEDAGGVDAARRANLREGRDLVHQALTDGCPGWQANLPAGGLSLWWRLPRANSSALIASAARHGLTLTHGAPFSPDGHGLEGRLRTPFALDHASLRRATEILVRVNTELEGKAHS